MLFSGCTSITLLSDEKGVSRYDDALLPFVEKAFLSDIGGPRVVTVNGRGSHHPFAVAAPKCSDVEEDAYDNSIRFTDKVVSECIKILEKSKRPSFLVYVSDHGESPDSSTWRCLTENSTWEIPFFVWMSDSFIREFPDLAASIRKSKNMPLQADQLFLGLLQICGISDYPKYKSQKDFLSSEFCVRRERMINYGKCSYEAKRK